MEGIKKQNISINDSIKLVSWFLCLLIFCFTISSQSADLQDNYPQVTKIETIIFGKSFLKLKIAERLSQLETNVFGKIFSTEALDKRTQRLKESVLGDSENSQEEVNKEEKTKTQKQVYNNVQAKEISNEQFAALLFQFINEARSFKGLMPLAKDDIATKVANEQASDLFVKGYLSYYNSKHIGSDERYTLGGGTGAVTEIIRGFNTSEADKNDKKIKLTELLAKQLVEAIASSSDDSQVLFNPYITHVGYGFERSQDAKKFVSVIEFLVKGGEFEPLKLNISLGEKLSVKGKVNPPFKFKAVSVAYFDESGENDVEDENKNYSFENENLMPYFSPQDYIAFGDTKKVNFINVIKGLGVVGALAGAPFTGGATAVLAPVLISSIQNGPPKEIPLKRGIKTNSKGNFSGLIDLSYQGMSGLYVVSVLGELPSVDYPVVISRRTVRVKTL